MTDEVLGNSDTGSSDSQQQQGLPVDNASIESQAVSAPSVSSSPTPHEEMLTLTDANNRIAGAKRKAYEKGMKDGRYNQEQPTQPIANKNVAGFDDSQISSMIESKMIEREKQQQDKLVMQGHQNEANRIVGELSSKMEAAKQNIPEYEKDMSAVNNFNDVPALLAAVYSLDNAGEVLHHLSKNRKDIPSIDALSRLYQGRPGEINLGTEELRSISDRLKQNSNGKKAAYAPEPISQIETNSRDGIGSGTPQSIADFKNIYRG